MKPICSKSANFGKSQQNSSDTLKTTLEHIINILPGHVYWQNKNGIILGCNRRQANSLGYETPEEVIGKHPKELLPENEANIIMNILNKVVNEKTAIKLEEKITFKQGELVLLTEKVPLHNKDGEIIGLLGISLDITEQKHIANKLSEATHKLEGMTLVAASIAHELRTPLASLDMGLENLKEIIPTLIEGYEIAVANNLLKPQMKPSTLTIIKNTLDSMQRELELATLVIKLLLENVRPNVENTITEQFSIIHCVNEALKRYPFKPGQKEKIHWGSAIDFKVQGSEALIIHILFNFIKNALYYIAEAGKGDITIWTETTETNNVLYFKDSGKGISKDKLPHIFKPFYSSTYHGAGIGLAYCETTMKKFGGHITCESIEDSYTVFKLSFPVKKIERTLRDPA